MKRFHVHVNVDQLESSIRFYTTLLGAAPGAGQQTRSHMRAERELLLR